MRVIFVSGKAQHGKDTFAQASKLLLEHRGYKVKILHYGDLLKYMAREFCDWDGEKDERGRTLLQQLGTERVRGIYPDFWVDFIKKVCNIFKDEWDFVFIPDTRFPNEIFKMKDITTISVRIIRDNFDNGLTPEQQAHPSETGLDAYPFDYVLINTDLATFYEKTKQLYD